MCLIKKASINTNKVLQANSNIGKILIKLNCYYII